MKNESAKVFIGKPGDNEKWEKSKYGRRSFSLSLRAPQAASLESAAPPAAEANPLPGNKKPKAGKMPKAKKEVRFTELSCWRCGEKHRVRECPVQAESVHCNRCHHYGHLESFCEERLTYLQNELSKRGGKMEVLVRPPGHVDRRETEVEVRTPTQGGGSATTPSTTSTTTTTTATTQYPP